jgi:hypothetical protein
LSLFVLIFYQKHIKNHSFFLSKHPFSIKIPSKTPFSHQKHPLFGIFLIKNTHFPIKNPIFLSKSPFFSLVAQLIRLVSLLNPSIDSFGQHDAQEVRF